MKFSSCSELRRVLPPVLTQTLAVTFAIGLVSTGLRADEAVNMPNIVLIMADDQGWGQTSYNGHPLLKTPNLDAMAEAGLRFDRFYAAAPVCSPTRASVFTGRSNRRTGVDSHGYALRLQEKTLMQALVAKGYATGHFGKWHLNGMRGPGVPLMATDTHHPGKFGFGTWLSVTNFFDRDPIMGREGEFVEFKGDSSEIIVDEALQFIRKQASRNMPSMTVIWYGTPHSPFRADPQDREPFKHLDTASREHYGELVAMDRSVGTLRKGLREIGIAKNTLVWFCSDNGGLPKIKPETVGGLRGFKGSLYEGGLRVPGIIEWPEGISGGRKTSHPGIAMDIFPTIAEIVGLPKSSMLDPIDGISLMPLFRNDIARREKPLVFNCFGNTALVDNHIKLLHLAKNKKAPAKYELYDLDEDPAESDNLYSSKPELAAEMTKKLKAFQASLERSVAGKDYPEGRVLPENPQPRFWTEVKAYQPYFERWRTRPEYASRLKKLK